MDVYLWNEMYIIFQVTEIIFMSLYDNVLHSKMYSYTTNLIYYNILFYII